MKPELKLELALEAYHDLLDRDAEHDVYTIPTPVHITATRWNEVVGRKLKPRACDFGGHLRDGRPVAIDAKHCIEARFDFARLEGIQIKRMKRCAAAGGIAGVVCWMGDVAWWLPVDAQGVVAGVKDRASWTPECGGAVRLTGVRWCVPEVIGIDPKAARIAALEAEVARAGALREADEAWIGALEDARYAYGETR